MGTTTAPRSFLADFGSGCACPFGGFCATVDLTGNRERLQYTRTGDGARLGMLVLHDSTKREYAYSPAQDLADTKVGTFTLVLYDETKERGWVVISMKNNWSRLFPFDK